MDITLKAQCFEWTLALATLLLDASVISQVWGAKFMFAWTLILNCGNLQVVECVGGGGGGGGGGDGDMVERVLQGLEDMGSWATSDW